MMTYDTLLKLHMGCVCYLSVGDWSSGMTEVSKTFSGGSIPSSPVPVKSRLPAIGGLDFF